MSQKLDKIKNFELYQIFMDNFLCQNVKIFTKIFELSSLHFSKCLYTTHPY